MAESRWPYLHTEAYRSRYALAAHFLQGCETILEIGAEEGWSLDRYVLFGNETMAPTRIVGIGPHAPSRLWLREYLNVRLQHIGEGLLEKLVVDQQYGVALLGFELCMAPDDPAWQRLFTLINKSWRTVIESPRHHVHSVRQTCRVLKNLSPKKRVIADIGLEIKKGIPGEPAPTGRNHQRVMRVIG